MNIKNPFSKENSCLNCLSTLCGPLPPSFLNLRAEVTHDDNIHLTTTGMMNINNREEIDNNNYVRDFID
jgi:hypothetical protein